jgi:hypothetical protein
MDLSVKYIGSPCIFVSCCGKPLIMASKLGTASVDMVGFSKVRL